MDDDSARQRQQGAVRMRYRSRRAPVVVLGHSVFAEADQVKLLDFVKAYTEYRRAHSRMYSARIAYGIAFRGLPF